MLPRTKSWLSFRVPQSRTPREFVSEEEREERGQSTLSPLGCDTSLEVLNTLGLDAIGLAIFLLPEHSALQLNDSHSVIDALKRGAEPSQNLFNDQRVLCESFHNLLDPDLQICMPFR